MSPLRSPRSVLPSLPVTEVVGVTAQVVASGVLSTGLRSVEHDTSPTASSTASALVSTLQPCLARNARPLSDPRQLGRDVSWAAATAATAVRAAAADNLAIRTALAVPALTTSEATRAATARTPVPACVSAANALISGAHT